MLTLNPDVPSNHCAACEEEMFGERVQLELKPADSAESLEAGESRSVEICADCAKRAADEAIQSWAL